MKLHFGLGAVLLGVSAAQAQTPPPALVFQSPQVGHVFSSNSGEIVLKIADNLKIASGEVRLSDELGIEIGRIAIAAGAKEVRVPLKSKGHYVLNAKVSTQDGQTLTANTSAGVVGPVPPDSERLSSSLGMSRIQGVPELQDASGSSWTRGFTPQNGISKNAQGEMVWWPQYNRKAPAVKYNWVEAVMSPPPFTVAPEHQKKQSITVTYPPTNWADYRKVVRLFASSRPWVTYFEGINEPDANHWKGTDAELVEYHRIMREEVHAVGNNQKVIGPCFWSIDLPHLDKLVNLGFLDAVDGISMHSYAKAPPEGKWINDIRNLKSYLVNKGRPDMPIFLTEYGWETGNGDIPSPDQELVQARYAARGVTLLASENLAGSQYFVLRYASPHDDGWSISRADNTPRPAYSAVSNAFRWLGNAKGQGILHPTPNSYLVLFTKANRTIAVGWDTKGTSRFVLPQNATKIETMTGAPVKVDGANSVELSQSPVFMEFDTPSLATLTKGTSVSLTRGKTLQLKQPLGKLALPLPLTVNGDTLSAPANTTPGIYNGIQFINGAWRSYEVKVEAPWSIEDVQINWLLAQPSPVVQFTVKNQAGQVSLVPYLKLDGIPDEFGKTISLGVGQSQRVTIPIRNYIYGTPIRGTAVLEQREAKGISSLSLPIDGLPIVAPPTGTTAPTLFSTNWRVFGPNELKYIAPEDTRASVQTSYDADALYLRVAVQDDVHFPGKANNPLWACDSIQFAFDLKQNRSGVKVPATVDGGLTQSRTLEYVVSQRDNKAIAWRFISTLPSLPQDVEESRIQATVSRQGTETLYNVKLPWAPLGLAKAPAKGEGFGFNLAINDSDGKPGDRHGLEITQGIVSNKDTTNFATLLLQ
jgi:hypothetical protein